MSTRKDLNIYNMVCGRFRWLVGTRPKFMNIYYCLYHIQADLGAMCWIPNWRPAAAFLSWWGWCPAASSAKALPRGCLTVGVSLSPGLLVCRALRSGKCTSCSSKKAQISVCTQLSVCVYEICSETAEVMAQCRGSGWLTLRSKLSSQMFFKCNPL